MSMRTKHGILSSQADKRFHGGELILKDYEMEMQRVKNEEHLVYGD